MNRILNRGLKKAKGAARPPLCFLVGQGNLQNLAYPDEAGISDAVGCGDLGDGGTVAGRDSGQGVPGLDLVGFIGGVELYAARARNQQAFARVDAVGIGDAI